MSAITLFAFADPAVAHAHFTARLAVETDADDVGTAVRAGDVDVVLLDARSPAAFAAGHVAGAVNVPHATIDAAVAAAIPAGPIVAYCWGPQCNAAHKAAVRLTAHGRAVKEMLGGFDAYARAGFDVRVGEPVA